jgi:hypothetical protein
VSINLERRGLHNPANQRICGSEPCGPSGALWGLSTSGHSRELAGRNGQKGPLLSNGGQIVSPNPINIVGLNVGLGYGVCGNPLPSQCFIEKLGKPPANPNFAAF